MNALVFISESALLLDARVTARPLDQKVILYSDDIHVRTFNAVLSI